MTDLFDFQFNRLVTPKIIRILYLVIVVLLSLIAGISLIGMVISLAREGEIVLVALGILGTTLTYFILVLITRIIFESILIKFRVAEDIRQLRSKFAENESTREVLYDLDAWEATAFTLLTEALTAAGVRYTFENRELVIDSIEESRVDILIDQFESS